MKGQLQLPLSISPRISFVNGQFKVNVTVISKISGKVPDEVTITIPFPKNSSSNNLTANVGAVQFNDITKVSFVLQKKLFFKNIWRNAKLKIASISFFFFHKNKKGL